MYELIKINDNDYYIDCPSKIGITKVSENEVVFFDSSNNKDAAKKALKAIDEQGWKLKAVYCTHSHADHIGGNKLLQNRTGCKIYASGLECANIGYPILEPAMLYGGYPFKNICNRTFLAEASECEPVSVDNLPSGVRAVDLSGHSFEMTGYITKNGTAFIGDAITPRETVEKYGISYNWNIKGFLESLERLKAVEALIFVPSHGEVYKDIKEIVDFNIKTTLSLAEKIVSFCETPIIFEKLLKKLFDEYGMNMSAEQYILIGSTVKSYLSYCIDEGKIKYFPEDNFIFYEKTTD